MVTYNNVVNILELGVMLPTRTGAVRARTQLILLYCSQLRNDKLQPASSWSAIISSTVNNSFVTNLMSKHKSFYMRQDGPPTIPLCSLPFFGLNTRKLPCIPKSGHGISLHRKKIESDPHYYHATLPPFSSSKHP